MGWLKPPPRLAAATQAAADLAIRHRLHRDEGRRPSISPGGKRRDQRADGDRAGQFGLSPNISHRPTAAARPTDRPKRPQFNGQRTFAAAADDHPAMLYITTATRVVMPCRRHGRQSTGMPPGCRRPSSPRANRPLPPRPAAAGDLPRAGRARRLGRPAGAPYVEHEFRRYLECGILAYGFARPRCPQLFTH
jgi:hypothetical protein